MGDISTLLGMPDAIVPPAEEVDVVSSIREIVDDIIDRTIGDQDVESMSRDQKIALIRFMNDREIFTIKGTLDKVAERMKISKVTVYSYLDEIRKNGG